jgi:hypothetical protein
MAQKTRAKVKGKKLRRCASEVQKQVRRDKIRKNKIRKLRKTLAGNPNCRNTKRKLKELI